MNEPHRKNQPSTTGLYVIRPAVAIIMIVAVSFFYNSFLVDKNLEMLKFSLAEASNPSSRSGTSGMAPLLEFQYINELSSLKPNMIRLTELQYVSYVTGMRGINENRNDVSSVLYDIVNSKKEKRGMFVKALDNIKDLFQGRFFRKLEQPSKTRAATDIIMPDITELNKAREYESGGEIDKAIESYKRLSEQSRDKAIMYNAKLSLGYIFNKKGKFTEAEFLYKDILKHYPSSPAAVTAKILLENISKKAVLDDRLNTIKSQIDGISDSAAVQMRYYRLGLEQMAAIDLEKAKQTLGKAVAVSPGTMIADQARMKIAVCEGLLGNIENSRQIYSDIAEKTSDSDIKTNCEYQLGQVAFRKRDYKEYNAFMEKAISSSQDSNQKALFLLQQGSVSLFDAKDTEKAKEIFDNMRIYFPASSLTYPGVNFADKYLELEGPTKMPLEIANFFKSSWVEDILPSAVKKAIEDASKKFVDKITRGVTDIILSGLHDVEAGDYVTIELSQKRLNKYIGRWFKPATGEQVQDVSVNYDGDSRLTVFGIIKTQKGKDMKGFISGRFAKVNALPKPYWETVSSRKNFISFKVTKAKVGVVPISPDICEIFLKPCIFAFNKDFPLEFDDFKLDTETILFAGRVREEMMNEVGDEAGARGYMEEMEADSGFVGAVRKEDLSGIRRRKKAGETLWEGKGKELKQEIGDEQGRVKDELKK